MAIAALPIAGVVGSLFGLSGAAATSAALALLGGGSIASGGLGIAGGYAVLLGGGAILGYLGGSKLSENEINSFSKENIFESSVKLLTVLKTSILHKAIDSKQIYNILKALRQLTFEYETYLDTSIENLKPDKKVISELESKISILKYTRKHVREILVK